ncbi:AraC family transcriptional regulator [Rhizobium sp. C4]|uniref:AraC family transcriptional regulator n=1 Tax=Rhizobium sp. C4 TaxID=1349800 RepID=UPI001E599391|nr:AraC family transcriptional regulator [Rhizobium sp. C4]MCD2175841.1 AraC family transcriptional regulator [Rhizobium sp. C4]
MPGDAFSDRYSIVSGMGAGLVEFAQGYGLDIRPECRRIGIEPTLFSSMVERVSLGRFCALLEYCADATKDEAFGLKFGLQYKAGSTGPFGYGLMAAPTLEHFLRFQAEHMQYSAQTSYGRLEVEENYLVYRWTFAPVIVKRDQFVDLGITLVMRHIRHLFGARTAAIEVELERKPPSDLRFYRENIASHLTFDCRINSMWVPSGLLSLTNPNADPKLFELMDLQCRQLRPELTEEADFREEMERFILSRMSEDEITLASAASFFGVSERTLQRRLAELDTTLNELRDGLRRRLAEHLMTQTALSATEVSYRLGYSAPSVFTRSFHRWFGTTPREYRSTSRGPDLTKVKDSASRS